MNKTRCNLVRYQHTLSLPLHFLDHFPDEPGLDSTRMSPFWIILELSMMEVVVITGAIRRAKRHRQQTNIQFIQARCPSCRPTNSVKALKLKLSKDRRLGLAFKIKTRMALNRQHNSVNAADIAKLLLN